MHQCDRCIFEGYILKYSNTILRIFGLFHRHDDNLVFKLYALALCAIDIFNAARFFTAYGFVYGELESFSTGLVLKIVTHLWLINIAFMGFLIYLNQERPSRERHLIQNYHALVDLKGDVGQQANLQIIIHSVYGVNLLMGIVNIGMLAFSLFGPKSYFIGVKYYLAPFHRSDWTANNIGVKIACLILIALSSFRWCLSNAIFIAHMIILIEFFRNFNRNFEQFVARSILSARKPSLFQRSMSANQDANVFINTKRKTCVSELQFEQFRITHLKLSYAVQLLSNCYREFAGITVITRTAIIFLLLYIMSDWNGNCVSGISAFLCPFWTLNTVISLSMFLVTAAIIHSFAHEPIEHIFLLEIRELSDGLKFKVFI